MHFKLDVCVKYDVLCSTMLCGLGLGVRDYRLIGEVQFLH